MKLFYRAAFLLLLSASAGAQGLAPGVQYDPGVPTLKAVIGHAPGEAITTPEQIGRYLDALTKAAPDRTRLVEYAKTWEGRPLHYLVIGSRERMARLDEIKRGLQTLASGAADADRLVNELPVVVWLIHGVHGNEISSSDAALAEAYHLLAARGNAGRRHHAARRAGHHRSDAESRRPATGSSPTTCSAARSNRIRIRSRPNTTSRGPAVDRTTTCST